MVTSVNLDPALIDHTKDAISQSPGWTRVGLTCGNERLREEALTTLAGVVDRLTNPPPTIDPRQLPLF